MEGKEIVLFAGQPILAEVFFRITLDDIEILKKRVVHDVAHHRGAAVERITFEPNSFAMQICDGTLRRREKQLAEVIGDDAILLLGHTRVIAAATLAGAHDFIVKGNWARLGPAIERELNDAEQRRARQRAERELRESENLRRTIVDSEPECIKLIAAAGTIVYMNPAGLDMVEADTTEQIIGHSVYPLIAVEDRERYRAYNERIFQGDSAIGEFTLVGLKGTRRWMESHSVPMRNEHGQIVRPDDTPIPRLYSAGELGSIYSYLYQGTGNIGECLAFGRISARNAVAEAPWDSD